MNVDGWFKSSRSGSEGSCVEANMSTPGTVLVRDSKLGPDASPILTFTHAEWTAFVAGVRDGEFDIAN